MCNKVFRLHWKIFAGVTVFVGIFSAVYEYFGRGIRSRAMIWAFLFPLLFGAIPTYVLSGRLSAARVKYEGAVRFGINWYYSGVAALTVGSIATGVVEIYGTTNHLMRAYWIVGGILLVVGVTVASTAYGAQAGKPTEGAKQETKEAGE